MPLFLLGLDGTVRRANSAAGQLVARVQAPGYPTGKLFTAFIDLPFRAALQSQLAAVVRTGEIRTVRCGVLAADGVAEHEVIVCPVRVRGIPARSSWPWARPAAPGMIRTPSRREARAQ